MNGLTSLVLRVTVFAFNDSVAVTDSTDGDVDWFIACECFWHSDFNGLLRVLDFHRLKRQLAQMDDGGAAGAGGSVGSSIDFSRQGFAGGVPQKVMHDVCMRQPDIQTESVSQSIAHFFI
jgi:hypothetical protein